MAQEEDGEEAAAFDVYEEVSVEQVAWFDNKGEAERERRRKGVEELFCGVERLWKAKLSYFDVAIFFE